MKKKRKSKKTDSPIAISTDDRKWRAECDARTLAEAAVIQGDKKRMGAAAKAATTMAKEKEKEACAMKKVAEKRK